MTFPSLWWHDTINLLAGSTGMQFESLVSGDGARFGVIRENPAQKCTQCAGVHMSKTTPIYSPPVASGRTRSQRHRHTCQVHVSGVGGGRVPPEMEGGVKHRPVGSHASVSVRVAVQLQGCGRPPEDKSDCWRGPRGHKYTEGGGGGGPQVLRL